MGVFDSARRKKVEQTAGGITLVGRLDTVRSRYQDKEGKALAPELQFFVERDEFPLPGKNFGVVRIVKHRPKENPYRREPYDFCTPRKGQLDVGVPNGGLILHEGAYRCPNSRVSEEFPDLHDKVYEAIEKREVEAWVAGWSLSGGPKVDSSAALRGYLQVGGKAQINGKPTREVVLVEEPKVVASLSELRNELSEILRAEHSHAQLTLLGADESGTIDRIELQFYNYPRATNSQLLGLDHVLIREEGKYVGEEYLEELMKAVEAGKAAAGVSRLHPTKIGPASYPLFVKGSRPLPETGEKWLSDVTAVVLKDTGLITHLSPLYPVIDAMKNGKPLPLLDFPGQRELFHALTGKPVPQAPPPTSSAPEYTEDVARQHAQDAAFAGDEAATEAAADAVGFPSGPEATADGAASGNLEPIF